MSFKKNLASATAFVVYSHSHSVTCSYCQCCYTCSTVRCDCVDTEFYYCCSIGTLMSVWNSCGKPLRRITMISTTRWESLWENLDWNIWEIFGWTALKLTLCDKLVTS